MILRTHYFEIGGDICEVGQIVTSAEEWDDSPQSEDKHWNVMREGDTVYASRLTVPGTMEVTVDPVAWLDQVGGPSTVGDSPADARCALAKRRRRKG